MAYIKPEALKPWRTERLGGGWGCEQQSARSGGGGAGGQSAPELMGRADSVAAPGEPSLGDVRDFDAEAEHSEIQTGLAEERKLRYLA